MSIPYCKNYCHLRTGRKQKAERRLISVPLGGDARFGGDRRPPDTGSALDQYAGAGGILYTAHPSRKLSGGHSGSNDFLNALASAMMRSSY